MYNQNHGTHFDVPIVVISIHRYWEDHYNECVKFGIINC